MAENQDELMVIAAWLYYEERLTHEQIAEQLHMSRVSVTRLLQRARTEGIIQFNITRPLPEQYKLETRLKEKFNLQSASIARTMSKPEDTIKEVSKNAAATLKNLLFPGCRLGLAFSSTLRYMVDYLDGESTPDQMIVQEMTGTYLAPNAPYGISWRIAEKLKANIISLPVPVVVQNAEIRNAMYQEPAIKEALQGIDMVDLAVVGIGNVEDDSTLVRTGHFTSDFMREIRQKGAVGDILLHFYNHNGEYVDCGILNRMVILTWEQVQRIPHIIGVATGAKKVEPIIGALNSGVVHHLVTDTETAIAVLHAAD